MKFELDTVVKGVFEDTLAGKVRHCLRRFLQYQGVDHPFPVAVPSALAGRPWNLELDLSCNP